MYRRDITSKQITDLAAASTRLANGAITVNGAPTSGVIIDSTSIDSSGSIVTIRNGASGELGEMLSAVLAAAPQIVLDIIPGETFPDRYITADSWPSAMPGTSGIGLTAAGAAAHFPIVRDPVSGRKGIGDPTGHLDRALITNDYTIKAVIIVYRAPVDPGNLTNGIAVAISGSKYPFNLPAYKYSWDETSSSGNPIHYRDGYFAGSAVTRELSMHLAIMPDNSTAGMKIGGFNGFDLSMSGEIYCVIPLNAVPSQAQTDAIFAALAKYYHIHRKRFYMIDGNSIADEYFAGTPSQAGGVFNYWYQLDVAGMQFYNISHSGYTLAQIQADLAASLAAIDLRGFVDGIYLLDGDVNSYFQNVGNLDAAAVVQANWDIAAIAISHNMKPLLCTCRPATGLSITQEGQRVIGNAAKIAGASAHSCRVLDIAWMSDWSTNASSLYVADGLHPSITGYHYQGYIFGNSAAAIP